MECTYLVLVTLNEIRCSTGKYGTYCDETLCLVIILSYIHIHPHLQNLSVIFSSTIPLGPYRAFLPSHILGFIQKISLHPSILPVCSLILIISDLKMEAHILQNIHIHLHSCHISQPSEPLLCHVTQLP
jgi:hypothetical protein